MSIEVNNLTHIYSKSGPFEKKALDDVSFTIDDGDFVGLIGHTGSGKSTLIQHLNGLLRPDSGSIIIDGEDITQKDANFKSLRSKVGLVFQYPEYQLFEETVYKDIAFGPLNMGLSKEDIDKRVHEVINIVGLKEKYLEKSPFDLSGGQKRRVAIAGVLAMDPKILILDEPTAGLDPVGRDDILTQIQSLQKRKNLTVILVSHSMEDVAKLCKKAMVMNDGKLYMYDSISNVYSNADMLTQIGLNVPQISMVVNRLKDKGIDLGDNIYTVESAVKSILKYLKEVGKC